MENLNPIENARLQLKSACELGDIDKKVYEILKNPQRVIEISIPVKMDDGSIKVFTGYRSCHSTAIGPSKGGVRFHPNVTMDEVKALSMWMSFKCGVMNLPYGGGKGGIEVDPSELSERELEELSRGYIRGIYKYLGDDIDIPAPDVNTNGKVMGWMLDEYIKLTGHHRPGVFTGKPISLGGSKGRTEATGLGVTYITRNICHKIGLKLSETSVILQGFGNVGSYTFKFLEDMGFKVIALLEWDKEIGEYALYNKNGISYEKLSKFKEQNDTLIDFEGANKINSEEFWSLKADILIPAALENSINEEIAEKLDVKVIVEGANGPVTSSADEILNDRGITIVPDILANSGGVTVSYYEWVQNKYGYYWSQEEVFSRLEPSMNEAFENIWKIKEEKNLTFRQATYVYSLIRISEAMKYRGWF
ncbi:Glu/Leu/Phe/Val family dehydrogenase [Lagierella massiliensis]|uniref:Glu/Leu/Phe/Val family dehydrogenase n=1 Tax=Lagierella massiliensis TaxID=1689303 RepID=UPI0006D7937B|nr:Glu/Leu/Phe/Val dehydrogenase [Lagierella massiliensis]